MSGSFIAPKKGFVAENYHKQSFLKSAKGKGVFEVHVSLAINKLRLNGFDINFSKPETIIQRNNERTRARKSSGCCFVDRGNSLPEPTFYHRKGELPLTPSQLGEDFLTLARIVRSYSNFKQSRVFGPDMERITESEAIRLSKG